MKNIEFKITNNKPEKNNTVYLLESLEQLSQHIFSDKELQYSKNEIIKDSKKQIVVLNNYTSWTYIIISNPDENLYARSEKLRKAGASLFKLVKHTPLISLNVVDELKIKDNLISFLEGFALSSYSFDKYKTHKTPLQKDFVFTVFSTAIDTKDIKQLETIVSAVIKARNIVNEPATVLTSEALAKHAVLCGKESNIEVTVFEKEDIEKLKMGGLLAVNKGSIEPPTFTVMKWKPQNHQNSSPIVLVGKGVTYDTGGLSLKPTDNSMDYMKSDMAGAATVLYAMSAIAQLNIPSYVIGLMPSTDNRLSAGSYAPGDIINMYDGSTVENLNSDAEGRLILADALTYAKQFNPELTINIATLTGAASRAIGEKGAVIMGNASQKIIDSLIESGYKTNERLAQFPFWDDYAEELKSEIADMKNVGGNFGGAITAGKFLEKFAPEPFIHIDIAGTAFSGKSRYYSPAGGTGFGVRLLIDFILSYMI